MDIKFCPKCDTNKSIGDFYKNKSICKKCWNKRELFYRSEKKKGLKGNVSKNKEEMGKQFNIHSSNMEKTLYDDSKDSRYTVADLEEELLGVLSYSQRNIMSCLRENSDLISDINNNEVIKRLLINFDNELASIKEMYIYE